jgi:hypothetical protein
MKHNLTGQIETMLWYATRSQLEQKVRMELLDAIWHETAGPVASSKAQVIADIWHRIL